MGLAQAPPPARLRVARATVGARDTLMAGITTVRDMGTEGAGYADVGLKQAIEDGVIPGPRMLVSGPAMVATATYGPKGFAPWIAVPQGVEEADGIEGVIRVARRQIGHGADFVKVYADYRWGPNGEARPTFSVEEIAAIVAVAKSSGRYVAAHASTAEGMRRAVLGGVETIDHGDGGTPDVWQLMAEKGSRSVRRYQGHRRAPAGALRDEGGQDLQAALGLATVELARIVGTADRATHRTCPPSNGPEDL